MDLPRSLQYLAILLAIAAAISWLRSASVYLPPTGVEPWKRNRAISCSPRETIQMECNCSN